MIHSYEELRPEQLESLMDGTREQLKEETASISRHMKSTPQVFPNRDRIMAILAELDGLLTK
jgi:hypothetical protein